MDKSNFAIPYYFGDDELYHFGIKGQKYGVRRFQNLDRTWTEAGKIRYGRKSEKRNTKVQKLDGTLTDYGKKQFGNDISKRSRSDLEKQIDRLYKVSGRNSLLGGDHRNDQFRKMYEARGNDIHEKIKNGSLKPTKDGITSARKDHEEFMEKLSKTVLKEAGYSDNKKSVEWLKNQWWFEATDPIYDWADIWDYEDI